MKLYKGKKRIAMKYLKKYHPSALTWLEDFLGFQPGDEYYDTGSGMTLQAIGVRYIWRRIGTRTQILEEIFVYPEMWHSCRVTDPYGAVRINKEVSNN